MQKNDKTVRNALIAGAAAGAAIVILGKMFSTSKSACPCSLAAQADMQDMQLKLKETRATLDAVKLASEKAARTQVSDTKSLRLLQTETAWEQCPDRIILLRHGESEGNIDRTHRIYGKKSDCQLELSDKGCKQAQEAGVRLKKLLGDEPVTCYLSPFERTQETLLNVSLALGPHQISAVHIDPRIREREFGNLQSAADKETKNDFRKNRIPAHREAMRKYKESGGEGEEPEFPKYPDNQTITFHLAEAARLGRFFYRFPNGESCADVYDRCGSFCESLFGHGNLFQRFVDEEDKHEPTKNALIVTHGLTMRLILMRYFQMSVDTFGTIWNGGNCDYWVLKKNVQLRRYELAIQESNPERAPWATREVLVIYNEDGDKTKKRERKCTIVDYVTIKQPRTHHIKEALARMVDGHGVANIGKYHICKTTNSIRGSDRDGKPLEQLPLLNIPEKDVVYIDWWSNSDSEIYPSYNQKSAKARGMRTTLNASRHAKLKAEEECEMEKQRLARASGVPPCAPACLKVCPSVRISDGKGGVCEE